MNHYTAILAAIKYLHERGVDVNPYLDKIGSIIGEKSPLSDVFNHDYREKGLKFRIDILPNYGHKIPIKSRDPREPKMLQKLKLERWLQDIFVRRFNAQLKEMRNEYKLAKPKKLPRPRGEDDFIDEIVSALITGVSEGVDLFSTLVGIGFDTSLANERAAEWARNYAYDLVRGIDETSLHVVQNAIESFIDETGFAIGDVIDLVEPYFGDVRASMIAVTETTRAFAQGQLAAAEEIRKEFPELEITKTWFTNNDDIVCDDCGPLDGMEIPMNDEFGGGIGEPPFHVNCRCWIEYNTKVGQ